MTLTNRQLSELLARRAEQATDDYRARAYLRAARAALLWPREAAELHAEDRPLTELAAIGTNLAARLRAWLEDPPEVPEPPPARRGFATLAEARRELGADPAWRAELKGDLQMHTIASDGRHTIPELARRCAELGHSYIAITDHTQGIKVAGGMDEAAFAAQADDLAAARARLAAEGVTLEVLHGAEMNLDDAGRGDMDPAFLARLDLVLGSFHFGLRAAGDQTRRYVAALMNPSIHVLAHPGTRRWNKRLSLQADWDVVFAAAAHTGVAIEIDCAPERQDLEPDLIAAAAEAGCLFSLGSDAHYLSELDAIDIGVAAAKRAGVDRTRILNYWELGDLRAWARQRGA